MLQLVVVVGGGWWCSQRLLCLNPTTVMVVLLLGLCLLLGCDKKQTIPKHLILSTIDSVVETSKTLKSRVGANGRLLHYM